ncbi:hypothetical protein D3C75_533970 [compost metagenome]
MMSVFGIEVLAAQTIDTADYLRGGVAVSEQRSLDFVNHIAAVSANGIRTVPYRNSLHILQRFSNLLLREWTNHIRRDGSGFDPLQAELVDHILDDFRSGVHQEYGNIGVFHPVLLDHRIVAAGQLGEFPGNLFEYFTGVVHGNGLLVTVVDIIRFIHVGTYGNRIVAVKCVCEAHRGLLTYELMNVLAVGKSLHTALLVRCEIAVGSDHDRKADLGVFSQLQGHQVHVIDGLRITAHQNRPAGIECKIQIGVVTVNVQRSRNGTADQVHDHRHARTCLYRQLLQHEHIALGAGCVEHASARSRCAVTDPCGAVLTIRRNEHDVMLAAGFHGVQELGNLSGRRDWEITHHMIVDLMSGISRHFVAGFI